MFYIIHNIVLTYIQSRLLRNLENFKIMGAMEMWYYLKKHVLYTKVLGLFKLLSSICTANFENNAQKSILNTTIFTTRKLLKIYF